jgi:hypothetical protein
VALGCPFRGTWKDGCRIDDKVCEIDLLGTGCNPGDFDWG